MVPNPLDLSDVETNPQTHQEDGHRESQQSFPSIHRSFAFDEWDEEEEDGVSSSKYFSDNGDEEEEARCKSEILSVIPSVEHGRTIYDATHHDPIHQHDPNNLFPLDTYMTVIHLDDTKILKTSSTSTETCGDGDHNLHSKFICPSIRRYSTAYRWGVDYSFQLPENQKLHAHARPLSYPVMGGTEGAEEGESWCSSSASGRPFPVPEFVVVYKNE
jgi:hypothetical protein